MPQAAPDLDVEQSQNAGATQNGASISPVSQIREEEVVLVLRAPKEADGGYLVYSLVESAPSDGGKPFSLSVVHTPELPNDSSVLKDLFFDQDDIPPAHLKRPRQVHVVVSTRSGLRLAPVFYEDVLSPLLKTIGLEPTETDGNGYRVTVTKSSNTVRDFSHELGKDDKAGEKTVILLSGDGGVVDLLNGLDHASSPSHTPSPPTIALLPLGTGNALFHSLHKPHYSAPAPTPSPLVLGLRTLLTGTPSPLPTFKASFSPGAKLISAPVDHPDHHAATSGKDHEKETPVAHLVGAIVASYGFHASLVWESDTPAYRVHGDKRFGMAATELLKVAHGYDAAVEVRRPGAAAGELTPLHPSRHGDGGGGAAGEGKFNYVLATLVSNLEKTFAISPAGRPLDGRLRLVHFGDVGGDRTMEIMMAAYREGEHVGMQEVGYEEVDEVKVAIAEEDAGWRKVCVDGSIVEVERGGWMKVQREDGERVKVLVG